MLEYLNQILPIIIYILLIALIILLIIVSAKAIKALDKVQVVVDDADKKLKTLDGVFNFIDAATDKVSFLSDRVISVLVNAIERVFKNSKKSKIETEEGENE